jgi:hypothetical protein
LALGALAALAAPGGAAAKPGYFRVPDEFTEQMHLKGTNGFTLAMTVVDRRLVEVSVDKPTAHSGLELVNYWLRRRLPPGADLDLRLGHEGAFRLHFVPHKVEEEPVLPGCKGDPSIVEKGVFVGSIRFHGKRGFTRVDARRIAGVVGKQGAQTCRSRKTGKNVQSVSLPSSQEGQDEGVLQLIAGTPSAHRRFDAISLETPGVVEPPSTIFEAAVSRNEGDLSVTSMAIVGSAPASTFDIPDPLHPFSAATVEPPAPFSGRASFELKTPTHGEFSGDLAVDLPGLGRVPLTGPGTAAGICQGLACTKTLPKLLRPHKSGRVDVEFTNASGS